MSLNMKKKAILLVLMMVLMLLVTACASGGGRNRGNDRDSRRDDVEDTEIEEDVEEDDDVEAEEEEKVPETTPATAPSELSDDIYSFQVSVDGTVYQFPMWAKDFAALGWTYDGDDSQTLTSNQYTVAETWTKGDEKWLENIEGDFSGNFFENEIVHFMDCIRNGKTPSSSIEQAVQLQKMLMGIYESSKTGREVRL